MAPTVRVGYQVAMRAIRLLMADRGLGGAIVSLIAYLVVLQGLVGAVSDGAMAGPAAASGFVLCSGSVVPTGPDGDGSGDGHPSCCMALCRAACLTGACLPSASIGTPAPPAGTSGPPMAEAVRSAEPRPVRLVPEARAPPALA
jgi:hypothetical protein